MNGNSGSYDLDLIGTFDIETVSEILENKLRLEPGVDSSTNELGIINYFEMIDNDSLSILKLELDAFQASEIDRITGRPNYAEVKVTTCHGRKQLDRILPIYYSRVLIDFKLSLKDLKKMNGVLYGATKTSEKLFSLEQFNNLKYIDTQPFMILMFKNHPNVEVLKCTMMELHMVRINNFPKLKELWIDNQLMGDGQGAEYLYSLIERFNYVEKLVFNGDIHHDISFKNFKNLKVLIAHGKIRDVEELSNLIELEASGSYISDISALSNLRIADITNTGVKNLDKNLNLVKLICNRTKVSNVKHLKYLEVLECDNSLVSDVDGLDRLVRLSGCDTKITNVMNKPNLVDISLLIDPRKQVDYRFVNLPNLKSLSIRLVHTEKKRIVANVYLSGCISLLSLEVGWVNIYGIDSCPNLENLTCRKCNVYPNLLNLKKLVFLEAPNSYIREIPETDTLRSIIMFGCDRITKIPNLPNLSYLGLSGKSIIKLPVLPSLRELRMEYTDIKKINHLTNLEELTLVGEPKFIKIDKLLKLTHLICERRVQLSPPNPDCKVEYFSQRYWMD